MKYLKPVDPHVHCRWNEYPDHCFLDVALLDAMDVGLAAMLEMPNTTPHLIDEESVGARREYVEKKIGPSEWIRHGIHVGVTGNRAQFVRAAVLANSGKFGAKALKAYFVDSTGKMGVTDPEFQRWMWQFLGMSKYSGVFIGHFEDETAFGPIKFDPAIPWTHSLYQNQRAEIISVENQIRNAVDANFRGTFYIAHLSSSDTLELVHWAKKFCQFRIVVEVTWHHLFLNVDEYDFHGNRVKMNPPLRARNVQRELLGMIQTPGLIDVIGTDHAPHHLARKDDPLKPASGIPALLFWPVGIENLRNLGTLSQERIDQLTFHNANEIFKLGLNPELFECNYDAGVWAEKWQNRYGFNPFSSLM